MKAIFRFNSKSKAKGIAESIEIARKIKGVLEEDFYIIEFDSLQNENLLRLQQLVGHLKDTSLIVDEKEIEEVSAQIETEISEEKDLIIPTGAKLTWLYSDKIWESVQGQDDLSSIDLCHQ